MTRKSKRVTKKTTKRRSHIVNRKGVKEVFDSKKVYASVYAAAINAHHSELHAERLAKHMMKQVNAWIKNKPSVESREISSYIIKNLEDKNISLLYQHHLDLC